MKNLTASECAAWLKARDGYIILSHIRPDGDTIGSGAAGSWWRRVPLRR